MNISYKEVPDRVARWLRDIYSDYGSKIYDSRQTFQVSFKDARMNEMIGTFSMTFERVADQKLKAGGIQPRTIGVKQKDRLVAAKRRGDI